MTTGIIYDDIYLEHRIGTHVESHERLIGIMDLLKERQLFDDEDYKVIKPYKASLEQIKYVHKEALIKEVEEISKLAEKTGHIQQLDMDTSVSAKTYEAALYSVGGNLKGVDEILNGNIKNGFALVRPPGHHSNSYKCSGFCIFNNVAIAAEYLLREKGLKRVAIIDWDCHHGNGTQDIFYEGSPSGQGDVVFFSSHQDGRTLYPGSGFVNEIGKSKGKGHIINFPMPPKSAEDVVIEFFEEIISPVLSEFKPEFILISAGFDTHHTDRLTGMGWTYEGPAHYLKLIKEIASEYANDRILITLEGGYEIDKQANAVYNCLKILNDEDELITEKPRTSDPELLKYVDAKIFPKLKGILEPYWDCF